MSKASIDYMNARRAHKAASGGTNYAVESDADRRRRLVDEMQRDSELEPFERTELEMASAWRMVDIRADAMWRQIFARFGLELEADLVDEIPF